MIQIYLFFITERLNYDGNDFSSRIIYQKIHEISMFVMLILTLNQKRRVSVKKPSKFNIDTNISDKI